MRQRSLRYTLSVMALLAALLPCEAWAERVAVRAGARGEGARLVFEWSGAVGHTAQLSGTRATITFDKPIETDTAALAARLPRWVAAARVTGGGKAIMLTLKRPAKIQSFSNGSRVVVDLLPAPAAVPKPVVLPRVTPPPAAGVPEKEEPVPPAPVVPEKIEPVKVEPEKVEPSPAPVVEAAPEFKPEPTLEPTPAPHVAAVETHTLSPSDSLLPAELQGRPLAVFRRGQSLFLVVPEQNAPSDLAGFVGAALAANPAVKLIPAEGGRVVRIDVAALKGHEPLIEGARVRFDGEAPQTVTALSVETQPDYALGARLLVRSEAASKPVSFVDPLVGDTVTAVPLAAVANGLTVARHLVQADLIPTLQGVAVVTRADGVSVISGTMGVEIGASGGLRLAEGLTGNNVTPAPAPPVQTANANNANHADTQPTPTLPPLLDFLDMGQPSGNQFIEQRQDLQAELAAAEKDERDAVRLKLARFYFINGMATEAAALWSLVAQNQPDMAERPEYALIRAIAAFSSGKPDDIKMALAAVNQPTIDAALWRGALAAKERDWPTAYEQFRLSLARMKDYPEPYITRLQVAAIEAALNTQDYILAKNILRSLTDRQRAVQHGITSAANYLTGLLDWQQGRADEARAHLGSAAKSWDQHWRVRAELALVEADLKENKATPEDALKRVERLRFAWRGDALEYDMLHRLADLHVQLNDYAAAFEDYARLAARFPNDPRTAGLPDEQRKAFAEIFQSDQRDKTPAFSQLAIWDRYPAFRPTEPQTLDDIRLYLASRMAGIDLIDRATTFYGEVLEKVSDPVARAEMGVKIAALRLLDKHSDEALKVLHDTEPQITPEQPSPLSEALRDERRILHARALFGQEKPEDALALLVNDYSDPAMRLRADITWRTKRWAEAAAALDAIIGTPPADKLPDEISALVVNRATALSLAGDVNGLADVRVKFGALMAQTPDASTFQILTRPESAGGLADRTAVLQRVAEVDLFQNFLERYRGATPAPAVADETKPVVEAVSAAH